MTTKQPDGNEPDYLARYLAGDRQGFRDLVAAYRDRMVQFFFRLCWDRDKAEDLAQDLFLKLLLGCKRYRPEGKMATFLYRVATNLWIDHYRSMRPRPRFHSIDRVTLPGGEPGPRIEHAGTGPRPEESLEQEEERAALRGALERLTEPHRLVFELAVYQERPYAEIGELLDIPIGTVKSRMHNATRALKEMLRGREESGGETRRAGGGNR